MHHDTAGLASDDRFALPERFGDGQTEALPRGLLKHNRRSPLERIDLQIGGWGQHQQMNIGINPCGLLDGEQHLGALRVVGGRPAREDQPAVMALLDHTVGFHDAHGVFEPIEA